LIQKRGGGGGSVGGQRDKETKKKLKHIKKNKKQITLRDTHSH